MNRKLFLAGVMQETNGFSPIPTDWASFVGNSWDPAASAAPPDEVDLLGYGAVLHGAGRYGFTVVPAPFFSAWPAMPPSAAVWRRIKERVLADLAAAMPVDAVFLFLHGAMSAQGIDDCEGDLIAAIRDRVGADIPIACEYDLHGNVSRRMVEAADFTIACQEYPHDDHPARSLRAVELLAARLDGTVSPASCALALPMIGIFSTKVGPMRAFVDRLKAIEAQPGVLAASVFHGFFAADQPDTGSAVVVTTNGDPALARRLAEEVARDFAETAMQVPQRRLSIAAALDAAEQALAEGRAPVVIADRADNAGGGASSDGTHMLRAILDRGLTGVAMALHWDEVAVALAHAAGEGAVLPLRIGGKVGPLSGQPIDLQAKVLAVRDDAKQAWFGNGEPKLPLGRSVAIEADGVILILCSNRQQVFSRHVFTAHGVDPLAQRLLVVKSTTHFYNDFSRLSDVIIDCDAPGTVTSDFASLPYRHLRRPKWPIDDGPIGAPSVVYEG